MKYTPSILTKFIWALGFQKKENFGIEVDGDNYIIVKRGNHFFYNDKIIYIGDDNAELQRIFNRLIRMSGSLIFTPITGHFYNCTILGLNTPVLIVNQDGIYMYEEFLCKPDVSSEELKLAIINFFENIPKCKKVPVGSRPLNSDLSVYFRDDRKDKSNLLNKEDYNLKGLYPKDGDNILKLSDIKPPISLISQDKNKAVFNHRGNEITVTKRGDELYYGDMYLCDMCEWEVYLSAILTSIFYDEDEQFIDDLEEGTDEFFKRVDENGIMFSPQSWDALEKAIAEPGEPTQELVDLVAGERNYVRRDTDAMQNAVEEQQARQREEPGLEEAIKIVNAGQYGRSAPTTNYDDDSVPVKVERKSKDVVEIDRDEVELKAEPTRLRGATCSSLAIDSQAYFTREELPSETPVRERCSSPSYQETREEPTVTHSRDDDSRDYDSGSSSSDSSSND